MKTSGLCLRSLALSALATACTTHGSAKSLTVLAPGILDLPVLAGSFVPEDCGSDLQNEQIFVGCIAYDRQSEGENGRDWDSEYVRELEKLGWQFAGGAANVYSLERPLANSECFERLSMIGWLLGDPAEIEKLGTASERDIDWSKIPYGVFIFLKDREPECAATP